MRGWWTVGRWSGTRLRLHWTTPLGAIFFGGLSWSPGFWVAFLVVVLVHELGHAIVVRATGHHVESIEVHGVGGTCEWYGEPTRIQRAMIAWGGVWAQLPLAALAFGLELALAPTSPFVLQLFVGLTKWNLIMAAFNLIPIAPFDGAEAWKLIPLLRERRRYRKQRRAALEAARQRTATRVAVAKARVASAPRSEFPVDDDAPLSTEAEAVIQRAIEIADRAARAQKQRPE